mmetsp:Transcript_11875/g.18339  ORF Transcript_11875/g.18339 Transcript_11875/m.18339 type:complete len:81 (+) Transcript_11875:845-1087(+)
MVLVMNCIFAFTIYYFQNISNTVLKLEFHENRKFKHMFNSIEDAVILLEGKQPKFVNSLAFDLFEGIDEPLGRGNSVAEK